MNYLHSLAVVCQDAEFVNTAKSKSNWPFSIDFVIKTQCLYMCV